MKQYDNYIIVVGNEKGGAGKTTSTMHLIASLLDLDFSVASIDVDCRQLSLSRYIENRRNYAKQTNSNLKFSEHYQIAESSSDSKKEIEEEEQASFEEVLAQAKKSNQFIIIDTPGANSFLSRLAHSYADTIITPINDSFIDLDVLAKIEAETFKVQHPTLYSQMIWEQKMKRAKRDKGIINWIVMRNRLSNIDAKNKRNMAFALDKLSQRIGFKIAGGFSERVIFRELFLNGLTLLDIKENLSLSHLAAKQELREFLKSLQIVEVEKRLENSSKSPELAINEI
jgi:chromosome partitioning protein